MFAARGQVVSDKPLIEVTVWPQPAQAAATGQRRGQSLSMLVDTGARFTFVPEAVSTALGIRPIHTTDVGSSIFGATLMPVLPVTLSIDFYDVHGNAVPAVLNLNVIELPAPKALNLPNVPVLRDGILGMDVLKRVQLVLDGPGRTLELRCADPRTV